MPGWPWDGSDLQPDPALEYGTLDNGLRYLILPNREPAHRVAMFLYVRAGAVHESDAQQGYAHFLEHMLFNGTTHYPPGTLVEYFQSIGMEFGADTNAHTGYDQTVYKLLLPTGNPRILADGLQVMADYGRGALLLEQEVQQERGVILAEKRSRDTVESRVQKARVRVLFRGTQVAKRDIIGTDATLNRADAAALRHFYDTWYRPDNMVLVVVGDMDAAALRPMIQQYLGGLQPAGQDLSCPDLGRVVDRGLDLFHLHEPDLGYTEVSIETTWNTVPQLDTLAWEREQLAMYLAASILDNRLQELISRPESPMTSAMVFVGTMMRRWSYGSLTGHARKGKWKQALMLLRQTLQQALQYGFQERELTRVKQELLARLKKNAKTAASRNSFALGESIVEKLNRWEVVLSPAQDLALLGPIIKQLSVAEVHAALRKIWQHERRVVAVVGEEDLGGENEAEERIRRVFQQSLDTAIHPWKNRSQEVFPYLDPGAVPQSLPRCREIEGIGAESCVFSNGLHLNFKKTDYQPNQVQVVVHFGQGRSSEPAAGLGILAESVLEDSGVGRLRKESLVAALAGSSVGVDFSVGEESFSFRGSSLPEELELLFHLIYTYLHDPAFRQEAFERSREAFAQMYDQLEHTVEGAMDLQGEGFLAGGNPRYGLPSKEEFMQLDLQQVKAWLQPILLHSGLEISVVGDFDRDRLLGLVNRFFGKETRQPLGRATANRIVFPAGKSLRLAVASPSTSRGMITVAWKTEDIWRISRTRRLNVLAAVLADRIRVQLRERLGAVYSPLVYNRPSRVDTGFGILRCQLLVAPDQADDLARMVKETAAAMAGGKISQDELRRALEPSLVAIRDQLRSNDYWLTTVLALSSRHPEQLQWPRTIRSDYAAITTADLEQFARQYLRPKLAAEVIILPERR